MSLRWAVWERGSGPGRELLLKAAPGEPVRRVVTTADACRRLGRSRRQVYRYIREGTLAARGKYLGEWLLDRAGVERLAAAPPKGPGLPASFKPFFPEYDVKELNAGRDRTTVLSRLLEHGGLRELRWALRRYGHPGIARFLESDGARLLSPRALGFWCLYCGIKVPSLPAWRRTGWPHGASA